MDEIKKVKVAKEIVLNIKVIIVSLLLAIISFPLLALYDGGYKACNLRDNYVNSILDNEKLKTYKHDVISLGYENNTLQSRVYYDDFKNIKRTDLDSPFFNFDKAYLVLGEVYRVSTSSNSSTITIYLYTYIETLNCTIEKIFGKYGIMRSVYIFFILSFISISFRYLFIFSKRSILWVKKYSK